ncbi:hypothetical protein [Micromonospora yangpuensis]|uniref:Uncharacterized protein n=1 Tax=Micromonospora yangpuensis TaxID=683228 RepID=A0A1C6VCW0_9ACTN|nr:hypothetical protein [Micromonospora yangpuensis]SCL64179.1 hypothetical protein GA0070617_5404 [Micromonospora yangpuensis]
MPGENESSSEEDRIRRDLGRLREVLADDVRRDFDGLPADVRREAVQMRHVVAALDALDKHTHDVSVDPRDFRYSPHDLLRARFQRTAAPELFRHQHQELNRYVRECIDAMTGAQPEPATPPPTTTAATAEYAALSVAPASRDFRQPPVSPPPGFEGVPRQQRSDQGRDHRSGARRSGP